MNPPNHDPWNRLVAAARRAPAPELAPFSYGFGTRVAALGLSAAGERPSFASLIDAISWRALWAAVCLVAVTTAATLPGVVGAAPKDESVTAVEYVDPIGVMFDLNS